MRGEDGRLCGAVILPSAAVTIAIVLWKLSTDIFPSLEAQAMIGPSSYGAQEIELTDPVSSLGVYPEYVLTAGGVQSVFLDPFPTIL